MGAQTDRSGDACRPVIEALNPIEQRLLRAGCVYDFQRRAWRCPACFQHSALHLFPQADGSVRLSCDSGCAPGSVLEALDASYFDVGPACFPRGELP